jgi:hypothetical protein
MAVTILQQPTYPNAGYTNLVYAISGSNPNLPQYQYVMDFKSSTGQLLTRVRQYPNPAGSAIFDVGDISTDYLEYDEVFFLAGVSGSSSNVKEFQIAFGEEYGVSISSSVTLYNGAGSPGNPAVTGTTPIVYPVVVEPEAGSYNWDTGVWGQGVPLTSQQNFGIGFNRAQAKPIITQKFETLSVMNNTPGLTLTSVVATVYDAADNVIKTGTLPGTFSGKYMVHAGVGPLNLAIIDSSWNPVFLGPGWNNVKDWKIDFNYAGGVTTKTFWYRREPCSTLAYGLTQFAFVNVFGVYDYYEVNLPFKKTTNVGRDFYERPFVNYSTRTSPYNGLNRGAVQYYTTYEDTYQLTTDWLTRPDSYWLSQLIESPSVFANINDPDAGAEIGAGGFAPIVFTNTSYDWNTNPRGQKVFQYNLEFKYANSRRSRKG